MNVYPGLDSVYPEIISTTAIGGERAHERVQISVIVPTHNEGNKISLFLEKIDEILRTSFQSYEGSIINDGSLDNTLEGT